MELLILYSAGGFHTPSAYTCTMVADIRGNDPKWVFESSLNTILNLMLAGY